MIGPLSRFEISRIRIQAHRYANKVDRLDEFAERFGDVVVENLDWADVFEKYDGEGTVFYCDPPYAGYEDYYLVNTINHEALVDGLAELEDNWIYSYKDVYVFDRDEKRFINSGKRGEAKDATQQLVMSFEPGKSGMGDGTTA